MQKNHFSGTWRIVSATAVVVVAGMLISFSSVRAHEDGDRDRDDRDPRIERGFAVAPVPLNLKKKDRKLVGLGSYLVNVASDCNGCHTQDPSTEFLPGGNPYLGQPKKVNPATYLGGGRDFGPFPAPGFPNIISRNLTPDKSGRPEGGNTFADFRKIMRTGVDLDHLHPNCSATVTTDCLPPPFNGDLLQIMPWTAYQDMTDHDLRAIYEYLRAIPCIAGPPDPSVLHNDCGE
jgi:hypothetical protein